MQKGIKYYSLYSNKQQNPGYPGTPSIGMGFLQHNPGSTLAQLLAQSINDTKGTAHAHEAQATGPLPAEANLSHSHQARDTTNGMAGGLA